MKLKRLVATLAAPLLLAGLAPAQGAPSQGGFVSDDVEYVTHVPFEVGTATGANIIGKYMYVTSWKAFSIYDISDPLAPELVGPPTPFGFKFENENVASNGKILIFSEETPRDILHIWDVEDKTNPVQIAELPGAGGHTQTCVLKCKYLYGSEGYIVDIRNPAKPKKMKQNWIQMTGLTGGAHDVEEFRNGFIITSPISDAFQVIDVRNPLKPKVIARGPHPDPEDWLFHSGKWPNGGKDRFILMQGEQNFNPRCEELSGDRGPFQTWSTKNWKKRKTMKLVDSFSVTNGSYQDGSPAVNALGCSAHWFDEHRTFKNGGLVAVGYYEHGTRFLDVSRKGKITEKGWFVPVAGSTSAAYWVKDRIVYSVDYTRGIDVLKWNGKF
jgi:hypothetical protein